MEVNQLEIETKNMSDLDKTNSLCNNIIESDSNESILNHIFIHKNINNDLEYQPLLTNSNILGEKLKSISLSPNSDIKSNIDSFSNFINNKIELFNKIIKIIGNSNEIMQIILHYLSKNKINPIINLIDLYFDYISINSQQDNINSQILNNIKNVLIWFFSCGFMSKKYADYIYQKLAKFQFDNKLIPELFDNILSLIEIIYGKDFNNIYKQNLIAKNYIYFCSKENSILKTNISKSNYIFIKDSCSIIMWFYIKSDLAKGSNLCHISILKEQEQAQNDVGFDFILNDNWDIDVKETDVKGNCNLLKEEDDKIFNIQKNKWIQLKIQIMKVGIKLNIFQNFDMMKNKDQDTKSEDHNKIKYETKMFQTNNKKFSKNNDLNFDLNNFNIIDLSFFINYYGLAGTIIFCKNNNPSEIPINSLNGLQSNKISNFIGDIGLSELFFIISPSLFINQKNKFIYRDNNITAEFSSSSNPLQESNAIIDYNYVYKYNNFINNIYKLGGAINILPLFEIFYKFTKNNDYINDNNKNNILKNIFYKLIKLIELLVINSKKNYLDMYYNNNNAFFESLQLFLENINEQFYQNNDDILLTLINIGKYVFEYCKQKPSSLFENDTLNDNIYNYFKYILFYPKIVLNFSLKQQNIIWNFFEDIKKIYKKKSKTENPENYIFNHSYYKQYFISFEQLNNFILLFSQKYPNELLSPSLINIIKNIFLDSSTKDKERESLILLINSNDQNKNRVSDKIIISIIEIYICYFDNSSKNYMTNNTKMIDFLKIDNNMDNAFYSPILTIKSFLSSHNYFIETLLGILSTNNLNVKKIVINLLRIISQKYGEALKKYFYDIETENKKSKKTKKIQRITKDEFYFFIQENISPNNNNLKIREMRKYANYDTNNINIDNKINKDKIRRKSSMDSININNNNNQTKTFKIDSNKKAEKQKKNRKKSKSCEIKDINEIKIKLYHNNDDSNTFFQSKKTDISFSNTRFSNVGNTNNLTLKKRPNNILDNKFEKISELEELENNIEDEINKNEKEENNIEKIEMQKTNCEITMILFDWLLSSEQKFIDKRSSSGSLFIFSNVSSDQNSNTNLSDIIINFILKFLSSNKDLQVMYKFLFILIGQKGFTFNDNKSNMKNKIMPINDNYLKLLNFFSSSKTNFIQFLEELMINSYLSLYIDEWKNRFNYINESPISQGNVMSINEYFKLIYENSKELIIDIYFHDINLNKNDIIYEIFAMILYLSNGLINIKDLNEEDIKIKNILLNLVKELLTDIIGTYNTKLDIYRKKLNKRHSSKDLNYKNNENISSNDKIDKIYLSYKTIKKSYAIFVSFIFEYIFLLKYSNKYASNLFRGNLVKITNFSGIPDFLKYEIDKNGNKTINNNQIEFYLKISENIMNFFNVENLIQELNTSQDKKDNKENLEDNKEIIFNLDTMEINKLYKELQINKDLKSEIKEKLNLLFLNYREEFNNFPLVTIITILNNHYIDYFINNKVNKKENSPENSNFIFFLNNHMHFILMIIIISCSIKENENYPLKERTYKEIQEIIFSDLLYNINNIIYNFDSQFSATFVEVFTNIITLISFLWAFDNEQKTIFGFGKSKSKNAVKYIISYYTAKYPSFFNSNNFKIMSKQTIKENIDLVMLETNNMYNSIFRSQNEDKKDILPNEDIFDINKFEDIYTNRQNYLNKKIRLIITDNSCNNSFYNNDDDENEKENYKNILLKVDTLRVIYDNNDLYNKFIDIQKRKKYRKIKKRLYSWNNSYSNLVVFYKNKDIIVPKKDEIILKYKLSDYLGKDMTRKLLVPILDIDYYMPNFKLFKYKEKLFQKNEDSTINQYENLYKIDLKIFDDSKFISTPEEEKKYLTEMVCYVKTTHHIRGKIIVEKDPESSSFLNSSLFFVESNPYNKEELIKNFEDYDSEHLTCFGSIFLNNNNNKDSEIFLKFNLKDIIFIFLRKYAFRNNGIEIFLSNHRSYYFKFMDTKKRDNFLNDFISILNKANPKNKLFKQIKGIDENNKTIIIGYFKDENNNKEYSSISNIRDLWKMNKISTLEYLMWVNIYGNRSFRDIAQYPVFPWILTNYESNTYEELINNLEIRDFNLPMGMIIIDERSKKRQEGYIDIYKNMVMELYEQNLINIKIKDEDENVEQSNNNINNKIFRNTIANSNMNINQGNPNPMPKAERTESVIINYQTLPVLVEQIQDKNLPKIPDYKFDIEKLYSNPNFEYEKIPYCFGSHYSNAMYVSHYLVRIFPYSLTLIEIQGPGFDATERLFLKLQSSFYTAATEKCDLREIIPEFFVLPEMFLNINSLELGKINLYDFIDGNNKNDNIDNIDSTKKEIKVLNEVDLPKWCNNSPYLFVEKYRKIFESPLINIHPWIDLIFGFTQRGAKSQRVGNLFLPYAYDGVINSRLSKEDLLKDRNEKEFLVRLFELGVHPCKVFEKKNKIIKNKPNNQLIEIGHVNQEVILPEVKLKLNNSDKKLIYINCYINENDDLFILDNDFSGKKINIQESKESEKNYIIKDIISYKEFPIKKNVNKNIQNKLIIKSIYKNTFFIITGFFDGSLYLIKSPNKISKKEENQKIEEKIYKLNEENIIKTFDKSLITSLEIDKEEKYLIYGTMQGSIVIYSLNYNLYKDNKNFIKFKKIFKSHNNYPVSSISINNDLNLFADCAYDGYVNIYALSPYSNFEIINSIYIDTSLNFTLDYVFLSAQPLASIALYSNDKCQFKCFSINGTNLHSDETDTVLTSNKFNEYYLENDESMSSPIIFTDYMFNDYLIYIFKKKYILIREFPSMKIVTGLNPTRDNINEELTMLCISNDNKNLYILEQKNNKIYIVNQKGFLANKESKKS